MSNNSPAKKGVVLLGHGSQRGSDTHDGLMDMVRRLNDRLGTDHSKVIMACLEFIEPDLVTAVGELVGEGINDVTVMPFLLGNGTHPREDLIEDMAKASELYPDAQIRATSIYGCDPLIAQIVVDRVLESNASLNGAVGNGDSTKGVVIVKAGTRSEAEDHAWLYDLGGLVEQSLGEGYSVTVAQSHFGAPVFEDAVDDLIEKREVSSVTVVPYIFFPGLILTRNIVGGVDSMKERHPNVPFSVTPTLGIDERLVETTANRVLAVWNGSTTNAAHGNQ